MADARLFLAGLEGEEEDDDEEAEAVVLRIHGPEHDGDDDDDNHNHNEDDLPVAVALDHRHRDGDPREIRRRMADARFFATAVEAAEPFHFAFPGRENGGHHGGNHGPVEHGIEFPGPHRDRVLQDRERREQAHVRMMPMRRGEAWRRGHRHRDERGNVHGNGDAETNVLWSLLTANDGVHCAAHDTTQAGGCARIVAHCRHHPADVNSINPATGRRPLHEAALRCHCIHVLQALRLQQIVVNDRQGQTPLHLLLQGMATRQLPPATALALVEELSYGGGIMIGAQSAALRAAAVNGDGDIPLHLACRGPQAMLPPSIVEDLLRAHPAGAAMTSRGGPLPLHIHCQRRPTTESVEVAQLLLTAHPSAVRALDSSGWTPLHYACAKLYPPLITLLLEADSSPPTAVRLRATATGETPLHILCRHKPVTEAHVAALRALLQLAPDLAAQRDARPLSQTTPLHALLQSATVPVAAIQAIVAMAPAAVNVTNAQGWLPLHVACHVGVEDTVVAALVQAAPATAHALTRKLDSPLSLACATNRSLATVRLLLEAAPATAGVANDYGYCPIHCLVRTYQPSRAMVLALLQTAPTSLEATTHAGETPLHLLSNNGSASSSIFHDMSKALCELRANGDSHRAGNTLSVPPAVVETKVGNTPLHFACFRSAGQEQIEALAVPHPEWLLIRNSSGFTPLQILCKSGRVDAAVIALFARLAGPSIFSMVDSTGNTPLHSAIRAETDVAALQALIRACPKTLQMRTIYGDTPLHLACLRQVSAAVVHEVAMASCEGLEVSLANCDQLISPIFLRNSAGQTPVSIAMEDNQKAFSPTALRCSAKAVLAAPQQRAFNVLAVLAKMLHYGPATWEETEGQNLVLACVSLHRKNVRLDPTFIRRAIVASPEQVAECDEEGNYPLHLEAGIPIEKMGLLDGPTIGCCGGACAKRSGLLHLVLDIYPAAAKYRNSSGYFPLSLMIQNGRPWDRTFSQILRWHPQAFHWVDGVTPNMVPHILARVYRECGKETVISLLRTRPDMIVVEEGIRTNSQTTQPRIEE